MGQWELICLNGFRFRFGLTAVSPAADAHSYTKPLFAAFVSNSQLQAEMFQAHLPNREKL
jgi:hypothetical protein